MNTAKTNTVREPFLRIVKKNNHTLLEGILVTFLSLLVAAIICSVYIIIVSNGKVSIIQALKQMWNGTFGIPGNERSMRIMMWDTAIYAAKLLCVAAALTPAFKMKFWNIGAEGQMVMGGLSAAIFMHDFADLPRPVLLVCVVVSCAVFGAIWGMIPAILKAQWGTNETLLTLMMNYVAMKIMDYFYNTWKGSLSSLPTFNKDTWFPALLDHYYTWNIIIFLAIAILMFFYLKFTKQGYEIAVVGDSVNTARYAGINVKKVIIRTMAISGAICGLCGGLTVAAQNHNISISTDAVHTVTSGYGFTAIIVAWLANFNTLGMVLISILILFLEKGTNQLGNTYSAFSSGGGSVLIGIVLFCIIGGAFFLNYRVVFCDRIRKLFTFKNERKVSDKNA